MQALWHMVAMPTEGMHYTLHILCGKPLGCIFLHNYRYVQHHVAHWLHRFVPCRVLCAGL